MTTLKRILIVDGPAVAATATALVVAWTDRAGARVVSVSPDGTATAPVDLDARASHVRLASTPRGVFAVGEASGRLRLWRVSGRPEPVATPITEAVGSPAIAFTGGRLALAWRGGADARGQVRVALVGLDGALSAGPSTLADPGTPVGDVSVAWGRGRGLVAWSDARSGAMGLHVATFDGAARAVSPPVRLSIRWPDAGGAASVTWDGGAFNVAWWEPVGGAPPRAYFALVDPSGERMGSAMRVWTDEAVGLRDASLSWQTPNHLVVAATVEGEIELRATGPRGCDMPL